MDEINKIDLKLKISDGIKYLRTHTEEEIIEQGTKEWYQELSKLEMNEESIEKEIKKRISVALSQRKEFLAVSQENLEKYIDLYCQKIILDNQINEIMLKMEELSPKKNRTFNEDVFESWEDVEHNIEMLSESDYSLKKFIKKELKENYGFLAMLSLSGKGIFIGTAMTGILNTLDYLIFGPGMDLSALYPIMAIVGAVYAPSIPLTDAISEWFREKKKNPEAVRIMKEKGIYDLFLQKLSKEKSIDNLETQMEELVESKGKGR